MDGFSQLMHVSLYFSHSKTQYLIRIPMICYITRLDVTAPWILNQLHCKVYDIHDRVLHVCESIS